MPTYRAFGYVIESDIELPELHRLSGPTDADWRIRSAPESFAGDLGTAIGTDLVYNGVQVRAFGLRDARTLVFDDTGTFQVRPHEREITWFPGPRAHDAAVRADIVGRVLALAAHTDGRLALHASAVSIDGHAVAFLGPKHAGKSTLAMALVGCGARLITDDTLVVRMSARRAALASPGVHHVRLWDDAARALGVRTTAAAGVKPAIDRLTPDQVALDDVPLAACYVLEIANEGAALPVHRLRLSAPEAAVACVRFSKLGALAGGFDAGAVLDRAAALTRVVPVYAAPVTRDLGALERLASSFVSWHADHDMAVR